MSNVSIMSLDAINERLLGAVGVGIAVFSYPLFEMQFQNKLFQSWFSDDVISSNDAMPTTLSKRISNSKLIDIFPTLDIDDLEENINKNGTYTSEWSFKVKRRTLSITMAFTATMISGEYVLILECQNITRIRELESMIESYSSMVERNTREIQREKEQVEKLLQNVMPRSVYDEYKSFGVITPQKFESVSVIVLEFIGFGEIIEAMRPATLVSELSELFSAFDRIGEQFGCERIKTTGGMYLCIVGMRDDETVNHASSAANAAIRFIRYIKRRNENADHLWKCRIGIATGTAIGSVIGAQQYIFDVFGEAIHSANEACSMAETQEILLTKNTIDNINESVKFTKPKSQTALDAGFQALIGNSKTN